MTGSESCTTNNFGWFRWGSKDVCPNTSKWISAILIGVLFAFFASPFAFRLTNGVFTCLGTCPLYDNGPTVLGIIIHAIIFTLIARLLMGW